MTNQTDPPHPETDAVDTETRRNLAHLQWLEKALSGMDEAATRRPGHNAADLEIDGANWNG